MFQLKNVVETSSPLVAKTKRSVLKERESSPVLQFASGIILTHLLEPIFITCCYYALDGTARGRRGELLPLSRSWSVLQALHMPKTCTLE